MVRKYTQGMVREKRSKNSAKNTSKRTVIVTGSTGSLGTHMLVQLLKDPDVEKVYCMNRSDNAEARQKETLSTYHQETLDFSKAEFLKTDFAADKFGLSDETYAQLLSTVTVFIHSAWSVDFNLSLESYETTHIAGTRRAIDFAAASPHNPPIIFISSIASVGNWASLTHDDSPVPETITSLFDNTLTLPQGYGESKHVAAQILATASHRLGIRTSIIRAGQLAGPSTNATGAAWNAHEWLPTLVHTSKILKKLPRALGNQDRIDWVPMDIAAGTVLDVATASSSTTSPSEPTQVFHLTNPHTTSWTSIYPVIQSFYKDSGVDMDVLSYDEWVDALKGIPRNKENAEKVPGLKLLEFYESLREGSGMGMPVLETGRAEGVSGTLRGGGAVDEGVVRKWLGQWGF
jgi:thioester reductase-like protein